MPVIATLQQDYPEWHLGRTEFSLWYLEIHSPALLTYLSQLRQQFADILLQPNTRQFHITLFICGFWNAQHSASDNFSVKQLQIHQHQLQQLNVRPFRLKTGKINSFESALFVEIEDPDQVLGQIRQALNMCSDEIAPLDYYPHITLGLYGHNLNSNEVFAWVAEVQQQSFEFEVNALTFGTYHAQQLQAELMAQHYFHLGSL
ncbi:2'-5' RNA ligase family protein [Acinetobacter sp. WCHAc060007]|nr:2'-5' RNA ligase family protein [Acinetobacter sp. WCHAc060007]